MDSKGTSSVGPAEEQRDSEPDPNESGDTADGVAQKVDVAAQVKDKLHETAESVQAKAAQVTHEAQVKAQEALAKLPPPARERVEQLSTTARQRPVLPAAVAALIVGVGVVLRRLLRRKRRRPGWPR